MLGVQALGGLMHPAIQHPDPAELRHASSRSPDMDRLRELARYPPVRFELGTCTSTSPSPIKILFFLIVTTTTT